MITLYTTHCPQCAVLESRLNKAGIEFNVCDDEQVMLAKGFQSAPMLEADGQVLNYAQALTWIGERMSG